MRTYVYIDGFNFYYGAVKNTPYKWLDFKALCQRLLAPSHQILSIKYFTAKVKAIGDSERPLRQSVYINALKKHIHELSVHYDHFMSHEVRMPLASDPRQKVTVIKTEEKGSDVNLALHILNDAWHDRYDCAVILSNDSDLAEALRMVKSDHKKRVGLILPKGVAGHKVHPSVELMKLADFKLFAGAGALAASQLPNPIPGTNIHKPLKWA